MALRFTHITFAVSNIERTIEFYKTFCDFTVARDRRQVGGSTVWLAPSGSDPESPSYVFVIYEGPVTDRLDHVGFQFETPAEVDQIAERARQNGCLHKGPVDAGGAIGYYAMLKDPDGHIVEFTCGQPILGIK